MIADKPTPSMAVDAAVSIAKKANVQIAKQEVEWLIDVGIALGFGVLVGLTFSYWLYGAVGSVVAGYGLQHYGVSGTMLNSFHLRAPHLRKLAAGRVVSRWQNDTD